MSLKRFHIVLISLSSLLTLIFGGWSIRAWRETGESSSVALAVFSFAVAAGLAVYIVWFARKIRSPDAEERERRRTIQPLVLLIAPGLWLAASEPARACSVCYGEAEGPLIDAARLGVWLLFGLVFCMQLAFVLFFVHLRKRARIHARGRIGAPALLEPSEESTP